MSKQAGIISAHSLRTLVRALFFLTACLGTGLFTFVAARLISEPEARQWLNPDFLREWFCLGETMRITHTRYLDAEKVPYEKLATDALDGVMYPLDEYSEYLPPVNYDNFRQEMEQSFTGIGVSLDILDDYPVVIRTYPQSGAEEAGLLPGDRIAQINGKNMAGQKLAFVAAAIKGTDGTKVRLAIVRPGNPPANTPKNFDVERRKVFMPTVSEIRILDNGIGYIRIDRFESRTAGELADALRQLKEKKTAQFVIDLRDNPGGMMKAAVDIVGLFCKKGTVVATSHGRTDDEFHEYKTKNEPEFAGIAPAILVNRNSASASEIVSGAMQDLRLGIIVGDRTFGKGLVQSVFSLNGDRAVKLTTARYVLPNGRSIHGSGVQPDILQTITARDRVLLSLAETRQTADGPAEYEKRFGQPPPVDTQLAAACDFLRAKNK